MSYQKTREKQASGVLSSRWQLFGTASVKRLRWQGDPIELPDNPRPS
jgi:hypothetical protein